MKFFLRSNALVALFAILFCCVSFEAKADHTFGSEITYKCTGTPGIFEVTLIFYRACTGIPVCGNTCGAPCSRTLQIKGVDASCSSSTFGSVTLNLTSVRDVDRVPQCSNAKSICNNMGCITPGTFTPGIERYEFKGFANIGPTSGIPVSCCKVRFTFSECCRNAEINTGATWQNFYVDAVVDRCLSVSPCNSSPEFKSDPFLTICSGNSIIHNNAAFDIDDDSLSFSFTPALQDFGSSVTYTPPFAYDKPMPWTGAATAPFPAGIRCDPVSGDIMFTPVAGGPGYFYGIVAIEVKQWKKISGIPTHIGTTRRDIEMIIRGDCLPNNPPRLVTQPFQLLDSLKTNWNVCSGNQLCFTVTAKDTDYSPPSLSDTTYLSWDSSLASMGATFLPTYNPLTRSTTGPREDAYQFCWTPTLNMARNNPYLVTFTGMDNKCPNVGKVRRSFLIKVSKGPNISVSKNYKSCNKVQTGFVNNDTSVTIISSTIQIAKQPGDYQFTNGSYVYNNLTSTPDLSFIQSGSYLVKVTVQTNNCSYFVYDTLQMNAGLLITKKDTVACQGTALNIGITASNGVAPLQYRWFNSIADSTLTPLNAPNFTLPDFTITTNGVKRYTIQVKDAQGCIVYDSVKVSAVQTINQITTTNPKCFGDITGSILVKPFDTLQSYTYRINNDPFQNNALFNSLTPGTYTITVKDTAGCTNSQLITITQPKLLKDTLTTNTDQTCVGLTNGSIYVVPIGGTIPYSYSLDSINYISSNVFINLLPKTYTVHIKDSKGCYTSLTKTVKAADTLKYTSVIRNPQCSFNNNATGEVRIYPTSGKSPYTYKLNNNAYTTNNVFTALSGSTYNFIIKDSNACILSFAVILPPPVPVQYTASLKAATCNGTPNGSATILATGGTPPYTYGLGTAYQTDSVFKNLSSAVYTITVKDSLNCTKSASLSINQPAKINPVISSTPTSCFESADGKLVVNSTTGGLAPYQYSLDSINYQTQTAFNNLAAATLKIFVKDSLSCIVSATKQITKGIKADASLTEKHITCAGKSDGQISVKTLAGTPPFSFSLNNGAFGTDSIFKNLPAQTFAVYTKDSKGCLDTSAAVLTEPAPIVAGSITGPATTNIHQTDTYSVAPQTGMNYLWLSQKGVFTTLPSNPTVAVRWDSLGIGQVSAYVYNDITCGDTTTLAVTIGSVGLNELSQSWGLNVYPNPAKSSLNIQLQKLPANTLIQLYDVQGKLVLQQELKLSQQLNIETLTLGMYMLKIGAWSGQVIKE